MCTYHVHVSHLGGHLMCSRHLGGLATHANHLTHTHMSETEYT